MFGIKHIKNSGTHIWYNDTIWLSKRRWTFLAVNKRKGWEYIIQLSTVKPWLLPKKNGHWINGRYTLYGWLIFYIGHANETHNILREKIACAYNNDLGHGLELAGQFFQDIPKKNQNLLIQWHSIKNGTHYCPERFYAEVDSLFRLYGYHTERESQDSAKVRITGYGNITLDTKGKRI